MLKEIKNKSELIYSKSHILFKEIMDDYKNGQIKTQSAAITELFSLYQDYFDLMNEPYFQQIEISEGSPLFSSDYSQMIMNVYEDFLVLYKEMKIITNVLQVDFSQHTVETDMVGEIVKETMDKLKDLEIYHGVQDSTNKHYMRDHFLNGDKIDYDMIQSKPLLVNNGNLTLPIESVKDIAKQAEIKIALGARSKDNLAFGSESNGFPGNNTEVVSVRDDSLVERGYKAQFIGSENTHSSYGVILDKEDSWFEYERVALLDTDLEDKLNGLGIDYHIEGYHKARWVDPPKDNRLKLNLQIALDEEEIINNINIDLYTPPNINAKPAIVKNIIIHDESGRSISVVDYQIKNETSYHFKPTPAKIINIYFEQNEYYHTQVGHIFYQNKYVTNNYAKYALEEVRQINNSNGRLPGPSMRLSDMGARVERTTHGIELDYPYVRGGFEANSAPISTRLERMAGEIDDKFIDMGVESVEAKRWAIGIRNIEINKVEYAEYGELITKPFYFDTPLDKISLNIEEGLSEVQNWFEYYVSIDDGISWHPIAPIEHINNDYPKIYTIKKVQNPEEEIKDVYHYLETTSDVYSLRFKVVGKRSLFEAQDTSSAAGIDIKDTPIIHSFKLNAQLDNHLELQDDSFMDPIKEPDLWDKEEHILDMYPTDPLSTGTVVCIEDWFAQGAYYVTGNISMKDPIEYIEFYEDNVLIETHQIYKPDVIKHQTSYSFMLDKTKYPIYNLANVRYPKVIAYDTQGVSTEVTHNLGFQICDKKIPNHPGLSVFIQNKDDFCIGEEQILHIGALSSEKNIAKVELFVNNQLVHTEKGNPKEKYVYFSASLGSGFMTNNQYIIKAIVTDAKGNQSVDRFIPRVEQCAGGAKPSLQNDAFLEKEMLCVCEDLHMKGFVETYSPVKEVIYRIDGVKYNPNDYKQPKGDHNCEGAAAPPSGFKEDPTPGKEKYYSVLDISVPGWVLQELELKNDKEYIFTVEAIEASGERYIKNLRFTIEKCATKTCYEIYAIYIKYYRHDTNSVGLIGIDGKNLPYMTVTNEVGGHLKVGWSRHDKGLYLYYADGGEGPGFSPIDIEVMFVDPYDDITDESRPTRVISSRKVLNPETVIGTDDTNKHEQQLLEGSSREATTMFGNGSLLILGFDDLLDKPVCETGDHHTENSTVKYPPWVNCMEKDYIMAQFYKEDTEEILTYVREINASTENDIDKRSVNIGPSILLLDYSPKYDALAVHIKESPGEKIYLVSFAHLQVQNGEQRIEFYGLPEIVYGSHGDNMMIQQKRIDSIKEISWVTDGKAREEASSWFSGEGSSVLFKSSSPMFRSLKECNVGGNIDEDIKEIFDIPTDIVPQHTEKTFCVYRTLKELQDRDYQLTTDEFEALANTNYHLNSKELRFDYLATSGKTFDIYGYKMGTYDPNKESKIGVLLGEGEFEEGYKKQETISAVGERRGLYPGDKVIVIAYMREKSGEQFSKEFIYEAVNCFESNPTISISEDSPIKSEGEVCVQYIPRNTNFVIKFESETGIKNINVALKESGTLHTMIDKNLNGSATVYKYGFPIAENRVFRYEIVATITDSEDKVASRTFVIDITQCEDIGPGNETEPEGIPKEEVGVVCLDDERKTKVSGGGLGAHKMVHKLEVGTSHISIHMNAYGIPDAIEVFYDGKIIAGSDGYFSKEKLIEFDVTVESIEDPTDLIVVVYGNDKSSSWYYNINCVDNPDN